ncbi:MAG: hypothetical protein KAX19_02750, partial [Candidatus Brocadiae bacterium]|nr:hypothetical protein [Candidatus Brocadiia bacterium]
LLMFFYGLFHVIAAYGLWSRQTWGLLLARIVYTVSLLAALVATVMSIASGSGIVTSVAGLGISVGILVYLFGGGNSVAPLAQRFVRRFGET